MRLEKFRVQNFKKIQDSEWVSCDNLTVFVGKNEAGKSALFRGLSKLNPSDEEHYDGLKEFPRRRYSGEFAAQDWPVATGRFLLSDQERQELGRLCPLLKQVQRVEATRHYSWQLTLSFDPAPRATEQPGAQEQLTTGEQWVARQLPQFIYFDQYSVIDGAIHLPSFAQQLADPHSNPRARATNCLFKYAGLTVQQLAQLGTAHSDLSTEDLRRRHADERAILVSLAANAMTQKFADWWDQRQHKFRYQLDGDYFRVWVSDDLDPSEIELDQRSVGLRYFFSFFAVFLAEEKGAHVNSVLLLDEPGLHLHGAAQAKVVKFIEQLSRDNQTMYSTHSPFLVDVEHLERIRVVYEGPQGTTTVAEREWPQDRDSLFPLQAAVGYQIARRLFIPKRQVIVEDLLDLWLLKAVFPALAARGRTPLRPDIEIVPAGGVATLWPLASLLMSQGVEAVVLLGGQESARLEGQQLAAHLLGGDQRRCLFVGDFTANPKAGVEDLFPESDYVLSVKKAYPGIDLTFSPQEKALAGVVNKMQALFERKGLGTFEQWRAAAVLRDRLVDAPNQVSLAVIDTVSKMFEAINSLFPPLPGKVGNGVK